MYREHRRLLITVLLLLFPALTTQQADAQYLPDYAEQGIDSALHAILMTRADLGMRWDAVPDDPHRFRAIKRLFEAPVESFDMADRIAQSAYKSADEPEVFFRAIEPLMELGTGFLDVSHPPVTDDRIRLFSKVDLDSTPFSTGLIIRRFLAEALVAQARLLSAHGELTDDQLARLVDYSDSLLLQSEDAAEASLVEMRLAERYALERNKLFFNGDANGLDYARLLNPGYTLFVRSLEMARKAAPEVPNFRDTITTEIWETPLGKVAIGGPGDDVYTGAFFCIVDLGGNDTYKPDKRTKAEALDQNVTLIIDFDGNDFYVGNNYDFGGTLFGASTLIDLKGDDTYIAGDFALGSGYFGVGVLYDGDGSDKYSGGTCVQGAGMFGIGLLFDRSGNDSYTAHLESQGFGFTRGFGGLLDFQGNDSYIAASPYVDVLRYDDHYATFSQGASLGMRPVASGGYGVIVDSAGNDSYISDIYGQGTAYWFGFGAVIDGKGNDNYSAYQYAQGAGVHLAFGVLLDETGNDNYMSHGVSQGCGHDIAFGGLYDAEGQDNYVVESLSMGGGNANAVSLFIDGGGDDGYIARHQNTLGYSDFRRNYGMVGIFLDLQGKDFYGTSRGGNDTLWTGSFYGVGLDGEIRPKEAKTKEQQQKEEREKTDEEIQRELADDFDTLFIQASAAPERYQYLVWPARNKLIDSADASIPFLLERFNTEQPRERLALIEIFRRMDTARIVPILIDTVRYGARDRKGLAIYILGDLKDTAAGLAVAERLLDTTSWRVRSNAAEALLKINTPSAIPFLRRAMRDTVNEVRGYAARGFAMVADIEDLKLLLPMLEDRSQIVRYQIQVGLQRRGADSVADFLVDAILNARGTYSYDLLYKVGPDLTDASARERLLEGLLKSSSPRKRADGVRLALAWGNEDSLKRAAELIDKEKNSAVLYELYKVNEKLEEMKPKRRGRRR